MDLGSPVHTSLFGQIGGAVERPTVEPSPEQADMAGIGPEDVEANADQGGLSRAVRTHQSEHLATRHCEAHVIEGDLPAKPLGDSAKSENFHAASVSGDRQRTNLLRLGVGSFS